MDIKFQFSFFTATTGTEEADDDHPSSFWLAAIAKGTMDTYSTNILKIRSITQHASRQLATDIGTQMVPPSP